MCQIRLYTSSLQTWQQKMVKHVVHDSNERYQNIIVAILIYSFWTAQELTTKPIRWDELIMPYCMEEADKLINSICIMKCNNCFPELCRNCIFPLARLCFNLSAAARISSNEIAHVLIGNHGDLYLSFSLQHKKTRTLATALARNNVLMHRVAHYCL